MKKLILVLIIASAFQSCRQYCFNCKDVHGTAAGQKCFHSEEEQNTWIEVQEAANPNQPTSCE